MAQPQHPVPWRPDLTFVASNAETAPGWFAEVARASLTGHRRLVLIAGALDWESYAVADSGDRQAGPLALGALVPPEDLRLLERLWAERPELATRWLAEIDREGRIHRAHALLVAMALASVSGPGAGDDVDRGARDSLEEGSS
jgi:hypothetical protein